MLIKTNQVPEQREEFDYSLTSNYSLLTLIILFTN